MKSECRAAQWSVVKILTRLEFYINYKKLGCPGQTIWFLGIYLDSVHMELRLPVDRLTKLQALLKCFLNQRKASRKELESFASVLAHFCRVIHGGRAFSRRVYDLVVSVKERAHKVRLNDEF